MKIEIDNRTLIGFASNRYSYDENRGIIMKHSRERHYHALTDLHKTVGIEVANILNMIARAGDKALDEEAERGSAIGKVV